MDSEIVKSLTWVQENIINNQYLVAILGGGFIFYFKSIIEIIKSLFNRYFIVSITISSDDNYNFYSLELWLNNLFKDSKWEKKLASSGVLSNYTFGIQTIPGNGTHFFKYKNKLFWVNKAQITKQVEKITYIYQISTLGITNIKIKNLINDIDNFRKMLFTTQLEKQKFFVYTNNSYGDWSKISEIHYRDFDSIYLDKSTIKAIIEKIRFFINNKQWYKEKNIPYKLGIILYGKPGCSKTTIIKIITSILKTNVYFIQSLENIKPNDFINLLNQATEETDGSFINSNSNIENFKTNKYGINLEKQIPIIALEDADSFSVLRKRNDESKNTTIVNNISKFDLTLSTILNIMDGMLTPDGIIFIMTTNTIDRLDPAIFRPGRIDLCLEIKPINSSLIKDMCNGFYNKNVELNIPNNISIVPAKLQELLLTYQDKNQLEQKIIENQFIK